MMMPILFFISLASSLKMSSSSKQSQSQGGRGRRSVRFKQHIEIRTYSILLGDHGVKMDIQLN